MDADLKERALSTVKVQQIGYVIMMKPASCPIILAAAAALQVAYEIVGEKSFLIGRDKFLKIIYNYQTKNGFTLNILDQIPVTKLIMFYLVTYTKAQIVNI